MRPPARLLKTSMSRRLRRNMTNCGSALSLPNARHCTSCARGARSAIKPFTAYRRSSTGPSSMPHRPQAFDRWQVDAVNLLTGSSCSAAWRVVVSSTYTAATELSVEQRAVLRAARAINAIARTQVVEGVMTAGVFTSCQHQGVSDAVGGDNRLGRALQLGVEKGDVK